MKNLILICSWLTNSRRIRIEKNVLNIKIITTYSVIRRKFVWIKDVSIEDNRYHLVSHGVKHVSSPYLNANMVTMIVSHIPNKDNIGLTDKDQCEGSGISRMSKHN